MTFRLSIEVSRESGARYAACVRFATLRRR